MTTRHRRPDQSIDQDVALRTAAVRLSGRFGATAVRPLRADIEPRVRALLDELGTAAS